VEPAQLGDYLIHNRGARRVEIGRERLREVLRKHGITFQRTKTWKETNDPRTAAKPARSRRSPPDSRTGCSPSTSSDR
jgi:hypothetical protein